MSLRSSVVCGLAIVAIVAGSAGVSLGLQEKETGASKRGDGAFEATAWLRVRGRPADPAADTREYEAFRTMQIQLLKSPVVLNAAVRRPGIAELPTLRNQAEPIAWIADSLEFVTKDRSEVMIIRLRGDRAEDVGQILAAVTEVYLDDIVKKERTDRLARRDSLEKKYKEMQEEAQRKRQHYADLVERNGHPDALSDARGAELVMGEVASLRAERAAIRTEARSIRADIEVGDAVGEAADPRRPARIRVLDQQAAELEEEIGVAVTALARRKDDLKTMETLKQEIDANQRVADQIGIQLESSAFDLTEPPRVMLLEEVTVRKAE